MPTLAIICQIVIALGIFNVWVLRRDRATAYRPAGAENLRDEFARYGFPDWVRKSVGTAKLSLAGLLLLGIFFPQVAAPAAAGMALLMISAIGAHVRVRDPLAKSVPAFVLLLLSTVVVVAQSV